MRRLRLLFLAGITSPALIRVLGEAAAAAVPFATSSSSRTHPIGLKNLGNTCYLNAQLQCHYHIPLVRKLVIEEQSTPSAARLGSEEESSASPSTTQDQPPQSLPQPAPQKETAALQALRRLFRDMHQSAIPVRPSKLCSKLGINPFEQQDSQEFWKLLLPAIGMPALTDLYQGAYIDYIVALDGSNRERRREEPFLDLSLEVQSTGSVDKALARLFGPPELMSVAHDNGWRPEKGADKVDAHKGSLLTTQGLPSILQLHLKRFNYDWNTGTTSKLNDPFVFPLQLDLNSVCKEGADGDTNPLVVYDLQSVVIHVGEYEAGHYYAYIRPDVTSDEWYRVNDEMVDPVSWEDVFTDATNATKKTATSGRGLLARISRALFPSRASHGYGGRTSSAYVLQYVRHSDLPVLYPDAT